MNLITLLLISILFCNSTCRQPRYLRPLRALPQPIYYRYIPPPIHNIRKAQFAAQFNRQQANMHRLVRWKASRRALKLAYIRANQ